MDRSQTCSAYHMIDLQEQQEQQQQQQRQEDDNSKMEYPHAGGYRCRGKRYAVYLLALYALFMGFVFISYLYTLDISGTNNKSPSKDIIIIRKDNEDGFETEDGEVSRNKEGKLLVHISFPEKKKAASVMPHYKSMTSGENFKKKCKQCALISSSGHLRDSKAGKQIDNFPCVIRMNNSPVMEFTEDVGAKTTVRVICHMSTETVRAEADDLLGENAAAIGAKPENVLYFGLTAPNHAWAKTKAETLATDFPDIDFYMLDEIGEMQSDLIFERETGKNKVDTSTWLSTGWYTLLLALDMCEQVNLYGFVNENYCRDHPDSKVRYHYFQSWETPTECDYYKSHEDTTLIGGHRFITEKAIFARWAKMYNVTFNYPEWSADDLNLNQPIDTPFVTRTEYKGALARLFERFVRWGFGTMM